jgi:hypothetical protein
VAFLAAMSPDLGNRHAIDADAQQGVLDLVQLMGLDYRFDFLHPVTLPFPSGIYHDAPEPHCVQTKPLDWLDQKYLLDVFPNSP